MKWLLLTLALASCGNFRSPDRKVEVLQSRFDILKSWTISYEAESSLKCQVTIHKEDRIAYIAPCEDAEDFDNYLKHEILHVVLRAAEMSLAEHETAVIDLAKIL